MNVLERYAALDLDSKENGGVIERLMIPIPKIGMRNSIVGSNPTPSANFRGSSDGRAAV
jgi:hypothetical protein